MPRTAKQSAESKNISLRIHAPLFERLERCAAADRRSINNMASLLLEDALDARNA